MLRKNTLMSNFYDRFLSASNRTHTAKKMLKVLLKMCFTGIDLFGSLFDLFNNC
jgi:hypothetical protein